MRRTRFAPSPTGPLHLGHAYAAQIAHTRGEEMLLRIEDIDQSRARPEWEAAIYDDLNWLGISYPKPVMRQSERLAAYENALDRLWAQGVLYPCYCTRKDIAAAVSAPQEGGGTFGPDGVIYPGTCRPKTPVTGPRPRHVALRVNLAEAFETPLTFTETGPRYEGQHTVIQAHVLATIGDFVVARRDMGVAYHLAVVVDDAVQNITAVTRGEDLFEATKIHVILQHLLGVPTPAYHHHSLIRDHTGKRLAKRDDARAISVYRAAGWNKTDLLEGLSQTHQAPEP